MVPLRPDTTFYGRKYLNYSIHLFLSIILKKNIGFGERCIIIKIKLEHFYHDVEYKLLTFALRQVVSSSCV